LPLSYKEAFSSNSTPDTLDVGFFPRELIYLLDELG